jgi:hypothetical protein
MVKAGVVAAAVLCLLVTTVVLAPAAPQAPHPITVKARYLPLNQGRPQLRTVGALRYAGGLKLTARGERAFGGLSGLDVDGEGRFVSQTDAGSLVRGRLVLDRQGRLAGLAEATLEPLTDEAGQPYGSKSDGDAEDITLLPGGGYAVSFEQKHRVLAYRPGQAPRRLGIPGTVFPSRNRALEALTVWHDPARGEDRLVEGAEDGRAWSCDIEGQGCVQFLDPAQEKLTRGYSLTSLDALPDGLGMVAMYRDVSLIHGMQGMIAWVRPGASPQVTPLAWLSSPLSVDNFEGIAAVKRPDGGIRLYIVSDDNFSSIQRTLLMAFDWTPPGAG